MERSAHVVRLVIATIGALASACLIALYSGIHVRAIQYRKQMAPEDLPEFTAWFVRQQWHVLFFPLCVLALGLLTLRVSKKPATFELAVGIQWLFALLWFACGLLASEFPEILTSQ